MTDFNHSNLHIFTPVNRFNDKITHAADKKLSIFSSELFIILQN